VINQYAESPTLIVSKQHVILAQSLEQRLYPSVLKLDDLRLPFFAPASEHGEHEMPRLPEERHGALNR